MLKVSWTVNPGCGGDRWDCNRTLLVHVKAQGANNTLNYLWGLYGKPSLALAVTEPNATLDVDWNALDNSNSSSVRFHPEPSYGFGLVIDKVDFFLC
jgi:hypothetical protein